MQRANGQKNTVNQHSANAGARCLKSFGLKKKSESLFVGTEESAQIATRQGTQRIAHFLILPAVFRRSQFMAQTFQRQALQDDAAGAGSVVRNKPSPPKTAVRILPTI